MGSSSIVCVLLCQSSHPTIGSTAACCLYNKSVHKTSSACVRNKMRNLFPGYCRATTQQGLTKREASIWLFMAQCRFRDAGLPSLTTLTTCTWVCLCVYQVPPQTYTRNLMHMCMPRYCMCAGQNAFHQSGVGIYF